MGEIELILCFWLLLISTYFLTYASTNFIICNALRIRIFVLLRNQDARIRKRLFRRIYDMRRPFIHNNLLTSTSDGYGDNLIFLQLIHFYETANFLRRSLKKLLLRNKNKFFNIKQAQKNTKIPTLQTENLQSLFIAAMHVSYLKA